MSDMTMEASTAYLEMPLPPTGAKEQELAIRALATRVESTQEFFEFLAMLGLDDDARMIEQAMELRVSEAAPRPSDISSLMI